MDGTAKDLMHRAIRLSAATRPHPNPRVGAIVVDAAGRVVAEAAHRRAGEPHAERLALDAAGDAAAGGTLYVTLEPCDHHGRTPPCTEAIIAAGVSAVVVGAGDPDPRVSGNGIERLRRAGLDVTTGVRAADVEANDPGYFHHRRTGRPRVTLKAGLTLDGQIAAADGTSQWITSAEARADAHRLRAEADAVMVGAGTLITDDPSLTVRLDGYEGPQPLPVVIGGARPLPATARLWNRPALVYSPRGGDVPAEVISMPGPDGVDLSKAISDLGARGALDVLVEGGPTLAGSLLRNRLVDRGVFYVGALLAGGTGRQVLRGVWPTLGEATSVEIVDVRRIGPDVRIEFALGAA